MIKASQETIFVAIIFGIAKFLLLAIIFYRAGILSFPPEVGDGHDYDMIAFSILQGEGFGYHWSDAEWRKPYEEVSQGSKYVSLLKRQGDATLTAYRPPAYPFILAGIYKMFGRNFAVVRILQAFALALALVLAVAIGWQLGGKAVGISTGLIGLMDQPSVIWSGAVMTESVTVLGVSVLLYYMTQERDTLSLSYRKSALIGGIVGLLILLRNPLIFWVPFIVIWPFQRSKPRGAAIKQSIVILSASILILAPWTIRNSFLAHAFVPFGTQSGPNLVYNYSDEMIIAQGRNDGKIPVHTAESYKLYLQNNTEKSGVEAEQQWNDFTTHAAIAWIVGNPEKVPHLVWLKLASLWWQDLNANTRLLTFMACIGGLSISLKRNENRCVLIMPIAGVTLSAVVMQNLGGERLVMPMLPALWILAGIGLYYLWSSAKRLGWFSNILASGQIR